MSTDITIDITITPATTQPLQIGNYQVVPSQGSWYIFEPGSGEAAPTTVATFTLEARARRVAAALALLDLVPRMVDHFNPITPKGTWMIRKLHAIVQFATGGQPPASGQTETGA